MALDAGVMAITIEFAKDLKDQDWFGKQDPYCQISVGGQRFRTRTAVDGGKNPVWNETFSANVINENSVEVIIKDEDTFSRDDVIGVANFSLAKARETGCDRVQVPVASKKSKKQHGFLAVTLKWTPNTANKAQAAAAAPSVHHALPPQPYPYAPYPTYYAAPPPPAAYYAPPPAAYYPPPQGYYAAPAPAQRA